MTDRRWTERIAWLVLAITVVLITVMVPMSWGHEANFDTVFYGFVDIALAMIGGLIAHRQPANAIGWIFCALGLLGALNETWGEGFTYQRLPTAIAGAWFDNWSWIFIVSGYALVIALFPTGRLISSRWRVTIWLLAGAVVFSIPGQGLTTKNDQNPLQVDSPVVDAAMMIGMALLFAGVALSVASLVVRFRHSVGLERLQLKMFVLVAAVFVPLTAMAIPFYNDSVLVQDGVGVSFLAFPMAAGLAVLRYRLYDIDVVINRTLVYGALTATLAATYLASVLVLQLALDPFTQGSGLAVAASTLAVAALFRPARGRIQETVDRRFFRAKYDAAKTLTTFASHLRDQVHLANIGADLLTVVGETVQPSHASLWLRSQEAER
jgi:hypothetical protein